MGSSTSAVPHSAIVRAKIELFGRRLAHLADAFWNSPDFPRLYREHIFQNHAIVRASVPLMKAAERACGYPQHAGDPVLQGFERYLRHHIQEESGHHEWILEDGAAMGIDRAAILARLPRETTAELVGAQYYWIEHYNPIALAGYIAVMEGVPPSTEFIEDAARRNNLPLECFGNALRHARLDLQHRRDMDDLLDSLPLTGDHIALIGLSSLHTIRVLAEIMEDILKPQ